MTKSSYSRSAGKLKSYYTDLSKHDQRAHQLTALHFQSMITLNRIWLSLDHRDYEEHISTIRTQLQGIFDEQNQLAETLLSEPPFQETMPDGKQTYADAFAETVSPLQTIMLDITTKYLEVEKGLMAVMENNEVLADHIRGAHNTLTDELVKPIPEELCVADDSSEAPSPQPASIYPFPTNIAQHSLYGEASAPVQVVAVMDFQCPYSRKSMATLERLSKDFGDRVHILFHHSPLNFHRNAMPAAIAAECAAKQGQFKAYSEMLFNTPRLTEEAFLQTSESLQLDAESFTTCYQDRQTQQAVENHLDILDELGAVGTPSFFINGKRILGAKPYERFKLAVEGALTSVKASGLTGPEYYQKNVMKAQ